MQPLQLSVPEAAVLASGQEDTLLLATIPEQIPEDETFGSPLLSPEVPQIAPDIPTEQALAQSDLPGFSQDEASSATVTADEWRFCYNCGSPGHWARMCPSHPAPPGPNEDVAADGSTADPPCLEPWAQTDPPPNAPTMVEDLNWSRCYLCGSEDHWKWACAHNPIPPPADMCKSCARRGHEARDCMTPIGWRPAPGLCFECGLPGHSASSCPVLSLDPGDFAVCYLHGRLRGRNNLFRQGNSLPRCKHDNRCDLLPPRV